LKVRWCVTPGGRNPTEVTHQRRRAPARGRAVWRSWSAPNPATRAVSLIHLVPSSYIVSLQNCMNEEYWRLAGPDLPDSPDGGNGIQFAFRYNRRLLLADEAQLDRDRTGD